MRARHAAYGFRLTGIDAAGALAAHDADAWPELHVDRRTGADPGPPGAIVSDHEASIQTPAAHLRLDRASGRVRVTARTPVADADLVHPCLWPAAAVFARWRGAETLHAGAFVVEGSGAWVVLGDRGSGKSTLLAGLAASGYSVMADDLAVVEGRRCFAGPRCLDLRPEAAAALGVDADTEPVRSTTRRRLRLPPARGCVPIMGFVYLAWDERMGVETVAPAENFGLLTHHRRVAVLGADVAALLDLAGLPAVRLRRPRAWETMASSHRRLLNELRPFSSVRVTGANLDSISHSNEHYLEEERT
jgi:energy-coupling factor transporter ATP-binding protein EcfA2